MFSVITIVALLYWPGLQGGYYLDDRQNLLQNPSVNIFFSEPDFFEKAWNSGDVGAVGRPVAMFTFAMQHALQGGFDPFWLKAVNLLVHCLTGVFVFLVFRHLIAIAAKGTKIEQAASRISLILVLLWLFAPINVGAVVYIVQRMNLLAALFALVSLYAYLRGRESNNLKRKCLWFIVFCSGLVLAVLSKENAILLLAFIWGFEFLLCLRVVREQGIRGKVRLYALCLIATVVVIAAGYMLFFLDVLGIREGYQIRGYSMSDRLLVQPYVLFNYVADILVPYPGALRFNLDFYETGSFYPHLWVRWFAAIVFVAIVFVVARVCLFSKYGVLVYISIGWFLIFHLIESSVIPLEFAFNHRNYIPSMGLLVLPAIALFMLWPKTLVPRAGILVLGLIYVSTTYSESVSWGDSYKLYSREAMMEPVSVRANAGIVDLLMFLKNPSNEELVCDEIETVYQRLYNASDDRDFLYYLMLKNNGACGYGDYQHYVDQLSVSFETLPFNRRRADIFKRINAECKEGARLYCKFGDQLIDALGRNHYFQSEEDHPLYIEMKLIEAAYLRRRGDIKEAVALTQSILSVDPENSMAHFSMFLITYETGGCEALKPAVSSLRKSDMITKSQLLNDINREFEECEFAEQ